MIRIISALLVIITISVSTRAQSTFQLLFEGEYLINNDSVNRNLDWFGFYKRDSLNFVNDEIQEIRLMTSFDTKTGINKISTSIPVKSIFLLGVSKDVSPMFEREVRCGQYKTYTPAQGTMLPGRRFETPFPEFSCFEKTSLYALGNVNPDKWPSVSLTNYKIFVELNTFPNLHREQEITRDLVKQEGEIIISSGHNYEVPYIYASGGFDKDHLNDYIICLDGTYSLFLTSLAPENKVARRVAVLDLNFKYPPIKWPTPK
jgi:hypothetical protein